LPGFEEDDTYGEVVESHGFEDGEESSLGVVELEGDVATLSFVADGDTMEGPELEVVFETFEGEFVGEGEGEAGVLADELFVRF
jgi:hypothetical protein